MFKDKLRDIENIVQEREYRVKSKKNMQYVENPHKLEYDHKTGGHNILTFIGLYVFYRNFDKICIFFF